MQLGIAKTTNMNKKQKVYVILFVHKGRRLFGSYTREWVTELMNARLYKSIAEATSALLDRKFDDEQLNKLHPGIIRKDAKYELITVELNVVEQQDL